MNLTTNLFISCFVILLLSNVALYFLYPTSTYLTSISDIDSTSMIITILIVLALCSITAFTVGITDAKPIIAFIIIIALLYQINLYDVFFGSSIFLEWLSGYEFYIGFGLVTNLINILEGTDYMNIGFLLINGLGFITLLTCVLSAVDAGEA